MIQDVYIIHFNFKTKSCHTAEPHTEVRIHRIADTQDNMYP